MATVLERGSARDGYRPDAGTAGRLLACVLVAGVVALDPWGFAPFGPVKITVIVAGVLAAAAALSGKVVGLERGMAAGWVALLGWLAVASVRAVDPLHAWIGTPDRRLGWLSWVVLGLAWFCGRALRGERDARRLLRAAVVAVGAMGAYAVAELVGLAPAAGVFAAGRLGGPYGQPAYLGAAGVLLTPVAVGLAADIRETRAWRLCAAAAAVLGGVAVLGSQTRAAWVGVALACAAVAPRLWRGARRRPAAAALALVGISVVLATTPVGTRLASIGDADGAARGRVDEWRTAVAAVADAPLLGYGPEGYRVAFPSVVDAAYARAHGRDVVSDRAHNGVLDVAVAGGVPAAAAYLVLLTLVAAAAWRAARGVDPLTTGLGVGVLAYTVQQQLLFPVLEVDPLFWLLAGGLGAAAGGGSSLAVRVPPATAKILAGAVAVVLLAGSLEIAADRSLRRAATGGFHTLALAQADRAVALRPDSIRARFVAARVAARGPALTSVDAALDRIEAGLAVSPLDPALRTEHARLLLERAQRSRLPHDVARARATLAALVAEDRTHPTHRLRYAAALALAGDRAAADAQRAIARDLAPRPASR